MKEILKVMRFDYLTARPLALPLMIFAVILFSVLGLLLSALTLAIITQLVDNVTFHVSAGVAWVAIIFSLSIGLLFGLYPANKAAKKPPIEALRYGE